MALWPPSIIYLTSTQAVAATSPAWGPHVTQVLYLLDSEMIAVWLSSSISTQPWLTSTSQHSGPHRGWCWGGGGHSVSSQVITVHHVGGWQWHMAIYFSPSL